MIHTASTSEAAANVKRECECLQYQMRPQLVPPANAQAATLLPTTTCKQRYSLNAGVRHALTQRMTPGGELCSDLPITPRRAHFSRLPLSPK